MRRIQENIWKILISGAVGVVLWGFSRGFVFKKLLPVSDPADVIVFGDSVFIEKGLFFPLLAIIGMLVLTWYVLYFSYIEEYLWGKKHTKGFMYGLSFFLIYMAAFFEFYHFFNGSPFQALLAGLADGTPLLLTGVLSGMVLGTNQTRTIRRSAKYVTSLVCIPIVFTIGRILFYQVIYISPKINQFYSILLIILYGITISLSYVLLTQGLPVKRHYLIPICYGLIFFPISLSGNIVICLKYNFPFYPMILLAVIDVFAIIVGGGITEFFGISGSGIGPS